MIRKVGGLANEADVWMIQSEEKFERDEVAAKHVYYVYCSSNYHDINSLEPVFI